MNIIQTLKEITNHPINRDQKLKAVSRYIRWQVNSRLNPYPVVYPFVDDCKFIIWKGLKGATGNIYCGLHEFEDMAFTLHFLRKGDLFADIGANVGSYTLLSAGVVGAKTLTFEPVPATFQTLSMNIRLNSLEDTVMARNIGLGSSKGTVRFTAAKDNPMNHVATEADEHTINVPVDQFDAQLNGQIPSLIKIDVEGFETEVLKGMAQTLCNPGLKAIIIELNGSGDRYGYDEDAIHALLCSSGFLPHRYEPFSRELAPIKKYGSHNTIYIRDIDFVKERLATARKFNVLNKLI